LFHLYILLLGLVLLEWLWLDHLWLWLDLLSWLSGWSGVDLELQLSVEGLLSDFVGSIEIFVI